MSIPSTHAAGSVADGPRHAGSRSRWTAVGAALAVTLGAGLTLIGCVKPATPEQAAAEQTAAAVAEPATASTGPPTTDVEVTTTVAEVPKIVMPDDAPVSTRAPEDAAIREWVVANLDAVLGNLDDFTATFDRMGSAAEDSNYVGVLASCSDLEDNALEMDRLAGDMPVSDLRTHMTDAAGWYLTATEICMDPDVGLADTFEAMAVYMGYGTDEIGLASEEVQRLAS